MKGIINYFSTTGNTKRMVEYFTHQTESVEFSLMDMKKLIMPDFANYDVIGFAFPVEFFGLPRFVLNWIRYIPKQTTIRNAFFAAFFQQYSRYCVDTSQERIEKQIIESDSRSCFAYA